MFITESITFITAWITFYHMHNLVLQTKAVKNLCTPTDSLVDSGPRAAV